jgi:transmembrane sensor
MTRDTQRIEDAATWVNRLDQPAIDTSAGASFDRWMTADARHREEFADIQALWQSDALTQALRDASTGEQEAAAASEKTPSFWRARAPRYAVAACAAFAVFAVAIPPLLTTDYRSGHGAGQSVGLADGSRVDMSGDTELRVRILPWRRDATLVRGEAYFDVHHEANRSFLVHSGSTSVRVLGTAFNVDRQSPERTVVEVYRGAVSLESGRAENVVLRKGQGARVVNDQLVARPTDLVTRARPDWQSGWFEAADVPMGVLVAKVQRYAGRPIRFDGSGISDRPVSGRFRVSDPDRVLQAIRTAYGVNVRYDRDAILISTNRLSQN